MPEGLYAAALMRSHRAFVLKDGNLRISESGIGKRLSFERNTDQGAVGAGLGINLVDYSDLLLGSFPFPVISFKFFRTMP
jgi:hypothetical protein